MPFYLVGFLAYAVLSVKNTVLKKITMSYCLNCGTKANLAIPKGDNKQRIVCPNCGYIHYENPKIICGSLVVHEEKVLLCRRAIEPRYGYWTLPAGFMEIGETVAEGAARETLEEAEAVVINQSLYCIYNIPQIGQVYMLHRGELQHGVYGVGEESLESALFAEEAIPWEEIAFNSIQKTLKYFFHDRKTGEFPLHIETIEK